MSSRKNTRFNGESHGAGVADPNIGCAQLLNCVRPKDHWGSVSKNAPAVNYSHPLQGCINDCFLIAALSSVAWGSNSRAKVTNSTTVSFYPAGGGNPVPITTTKTFPQDKDSNLLYARSNGGYHWPMLYEKAYAKWKNNTTSDEPDYSAAFGNGGDGYNALKELTGYRTNTIKKGVEIDPQGHVVYTLPTFADSTILSDLGDYDGNKLKNAAVALTRNDITLPTGLSGMHTYSILGKYAESSKNYIVLRNPYCHQIAPPEPTDSAIVAKPAALWENMINLTKTDDGIFALLMSKFKECFAYYAIVKP